LRSVSTEPLGSILFPRHQDSCVRLTITQDGAYHGRHAENPTSSTESGEWVRARSTERTVERIRGAWQTRRKSPIIQIN
jgi:hypothetical protein